MAAGSLITPIALTTQPLESVTSTDMPPAIRPVAVAFVCDARSVHK